MSQISRLLFLSIVVYCRSLVASCFFFIILNCLILKNALGLDKICVFFKHKLIFAPVNLVLFKDLIY